MDVWHLDPEDLIPASEAAEIAGVSEAAVRQWATRGKIHRFPGLRRCDGTMYARPELEAIAVERQRTDIAPAANARGTHTRRTTSQAA